jgi:hypothetical protein
MMAFHLKRLFITLCVALFFSASLCAMADSTEKIDAKKMQKQFLELQQQLIELEKKHEEEINALKDKIEKLYQTRGVKEEEEELEALRRLTEDEAKIEAPEEEKIEEATYKSGALSLQALNPELSVTGDMFAFYRTETDAPDDGRAEFRTLEIAFESYLDPYSRFKSIVEFGEEEVELGEAYFIRHGLLPNFNLTLGKFRQQFGVVNRWHKHGLDQHDFPVPLRQIFGEGGLNQIGASGEWMIPTRGKTSHAIQSEITNGQNDRLFGLNTANNPSILLRYKNYRDLSKDTYMDIGVTGLVGWNDEWPIALGGDFAFENDPMSTSVYGADFTLLWEPTERMRYKNLLWRTEAYLLDKNILAPDGSGKDDIKAWGAFSYVQGRVSRTLELGMRVDYYEPDTKSYSDLASFYLYPHAVTAYDAHLWQVSPYIKWYQSPWVHFRIEYDLQDGKFFPTEDRIIFQMIFSAGPHKHERY